ncbi:MAG: DUF3458 domain-containing protein, partial [Pyrinomonadaceae bacterium]|nr:DUF3458 domain-containing protein [Pyrinomonadaceae bacterium]
KNWSNLWLNEGFATIMESVFIESQYGREEYLKEMKTNANAYFGEESAGIRHPLQNPRALPNITLFDSTTYKKGAVVINMLREQVGDEMFWKSVNNYLNKHKYQNVESKDLQTAFEQTSGQNLDWFFEQWVRKAGFPRLKVEPEFDVANKKLTLKVKQTHKFDEQTSEVFRLFADVEVITPNGTKIEKLEMTQREQIFTFDVDAKPTKIVFDKREQILKKIDVSGISEIKRLPAEK